jgi:uncharacterized protein YPO0396
MNIINNTQAGYRLEYLEVFNWGTFDAGTNGRVHKLTPNGQNSLLTGKNGSGKTTLVHALLVLMVKNYGSHFSQGDEKKERDEKTYFHGAFGNLKADTETVKKQQLRPMKDHYSILLAYFSNPEGAGVTLAQIRYYSGSGTLHRDFVFAQAPLTIETHFSDIDIKGVWKRQLKKKQVSIEFLDSFERYSNRFGVAFGLKDKAMSLFAKTMGVKVLGDLNQFIRENMLEDTGAEDEFIKLRDSYDKVITIYNDIVKAEKQLELLTPIEKLLKEYDRIEAKIKEFKNAGDYLPVFFNQKKLAILKEGILHKASEQQLCAQAHAAIDNQLKDLNTQRDTLRDEISKNDIQNQLNAAKEAVEALEKRVKNKQKIENQYITLAQSLGLNTDFTQNGQNVFEQNRVAAEALQPQLSEAHEAIILKIAQLGIEKVQIEADLVQKRKDLTYLRKNRTRITGKIADIREDIIQKVLGGKVTKTQLPFVAELIKLKETEKQKWELALEKLLNSFGMCLLVSAEHYERVHRYVKETHLGGYLVYNHVQPRRYAPMMSTPASVVTKLDLKTVPHFTDWIKNELHYRFDHLCTDNDETFYKVNKAITSSGLIKNGTRNEKDDRNFRMTPILGWENEADIRNLEAAIKAVETEFNSFDKKSTVLNQQKAELNTQVANAIKLLDCKSFEEMDHRTTESLRKTAVAAYDDLSKSAATDILNSLKNQVANIEEELTKANKSFRQCDLKLDGLKKQLESYQSQQHICNENLKKLTLIEPAVYEPVLREFITTYQWKIETIDTDYNGCKAKIESRIQSNTSILKTKKSDIEVKMGEFIRPSRAIYELFPQWETEMQADFGKTYDHRDTFTERYNKLVADDLPQYRKRFKEKVNTDVITQITFFKNFLKKIEDEITKKIEDEINPSLRQIDYQTQRTTYIQLECNKNKVEEIMQLKNLLVNILETYESEYGEANQLKGDAPAYTSTFKLIKNLIDSLNKDDAYRKRVIDVRNWLVFGAREKYRDDDSEKQYYENSKGLSRGEKAKLFYTILSTAIANQFNIQLRSVDNKSFRFIVIDEAFSDVDPENTKYIMELFNTLYLQVMIVTPLDKINLVETYIKGVHYIEMTEQRYSKVRNMPIEEYEKRKQLVLNL